DRDVRWRAGNGAMAIRTRQSRKTDSKARDRLRPRNRPVLFVSPGVVFAVVEEVGPGGVEVYVLVGIGIDVRRALRPRDGIGGGVLAGGDARVLCVRGHVEVRRAFGYGGVEQFDGIGHGGRVGLVEGVAAAV